MLNLTVKRSCRGLIRRTLSLLLCVCLLLTMTVSMSSCSAPERTTMYEYNGSTVSADLYAYVLAKTKYYYFDKMTSLAQQYSYTLTDDASFWNTEMTEGRTCAQIVTDETQSMLMGFLIENKLAAEYGFTGISESAKTEFEANKKAEIDKYDGCKDRWLIELAKYGLTESDWEYFYGSNYRTSEFQEFLYGENGPLAISEEVIRDEADNFIKENCIKISYIAYTWMSAPAESNTSTDLSEDNSESSVDEETSVTSEETSATSEETSATSEETSVTSEETSSTSDDTSETSGDDEEDAGKELTREKINKIVGMLESGEKTFEDFIPAEDATEKGEYDSEASTLSEVYETSTINSVFSITATDYEAGVIKAFETDSGVFILRFEEIVQEDYDNYYNDNKDEVYSTLKSEAYLDLIAKYSDDVTINKEELEKFDVLIVERIDF